MRLIKYICVLMMLSKISFAQQDPQYSQYMFNQLAINPAYAGSKQALSTVLDLRKQWTAMPGSPMTGSISMHGLVLNSLGIGGHLITESIGPTNWTSAYVDLAYHFKVGNGKMSLGVSAGLVNYNINTAKLDYKDAAEPTLNYTGAKTAFDVNAGLYYHSQSFFAGVSVTHLNSPEFYKYVNTQSSSSNSGFAFNLQSHYFAYVGKGFTINDNLVFSPSLMVKAVRLNNFSADLNLNFLIKNRVWIGVSGRLNYGIVGLVQVLITNKFKIGYAYDQGLNKIGTQGQGSHEIMLSYDFNTFKSKMLSPRYL